MSIFILSFWGFQLFLSFQLLSELSVQLFKAGTALFNQEENLSAFADGDSMKNLPYAARKISKFQCLIVSTALCLQGRQLVKSKRGACVSLEAF